MWTYVNNYQAKKIPGDKPHRFGDGFFPFLELSGSRGQVDPPTQHASGALCHRPPNSLCVRGEMRHLAGCHPLVIHQQYYLVKENRPWKSPGFSGNSSSKPDDCQGRTVNLLGISCWLFHKIPWGRYLIGQDVWPLRCKDFLLTLAMRKRRLEQLEPQRVTSW